MEEIYKKRITQKKTENEIFELIILSLQAGDIELEGLL
jgi:hypothetical protein